MKPKIRPLRNLGPLDGPWFECKGFIPGTKLEGWGYGRTIEEAYESWLSEEILF